MPAGCERTARSGDWRRGDAAHAQRGERWRAEDEGDAWGVAGGVKVQREVAAGVVVVADDAQLRGRGAEGGRGGDGWGGGDEGGGGRNGPLVGLLWRGVEMRDPFNLAAKGVCSPVRSNAVVDVLEVDVSWRVGFVRWNDERHGDAGDCSRG